jgi:hypothetical protein
MATKTNSKFPTKQIQCVALHDLFDENTLEAVTLKLMEEYPDSMQEVRDERIWSAKGFLRFINHWINSDYYHLQDSSFVYIETLRTSGWRISDERLYSRELLERMDANELQQEIEDYKAICKTKDFLLNHPDCFVYNDLFSSSKPNPELLYNIDVVSIDDICKFEWNVAFEEHLDGHNLLLGADRVIHYLEDWIKWNGEGDQDEYVINFRKTIKKLKKNPKVFVIIKDDWQKPNDPYWDWT